ncbi:hypothetical protein EDD90_2731 [Streptomyces sp. Ag109_O5-1]|uniref:hypothetical protein n=1 Tax=Streptomyces sp. Ag109_O5-1 TaxID=1938851 RepID=UPI000F4E17AF|nr:hypothetical protein [Streptomyces sp. Ag109_O5-1]RPE39714.1 hypothetical protein EDD90_2731 [Streptomyces sp. Ag109_O5-1]
MNVLDPAVLPADRRTQIENLLTVIAGPWLATGEWPVWSHVQDYFDRYREDADELLMSLPRVGNVQPFGHGYGYTVGVRFPVGEEDKVRLTVASSLILPEVRMMVGDPFVRVVRHMVKLHAGKRPSPNEVTYAQLRSDELAVAMPHLKPWFIKALPDLLSFEPGIATAGRNFEPDGTWSLGITRTIRAFRDVDSVEEYIEITNRIVEEEVTKHAQRYIRTGKFGLLGEEIEPEPAPPTTEPERAPYIDAGLLADLEAAAANTPWKVHKLIALCQGLNDAYVTGNAYICNMAIRAILDHIPPVFGYSDFKHVAAQYTFTNMKGTDKAHAQFLASFKPIGDDVMHRPIGPNVPVISMGDVPQPLRLSAILHEVLELFRKAAVATP